MSAIGYAQLPWCTAVCDEGGRSVDVQGRLIEHTGTADRPAYQILTVYNAYANTLKIINLLLTLWSCCQRDASCKYLSPSIS
jgi:hypothetical protein